jgi:hypothetical protein
MTTLDTEGEGMVKYIDEIKEAYKQFMVSVSSSQS